MPAELVNIVASVTDADMGAEIRSRRIRVLGERSQARLAREANVHRNTIINAEKGAVDNITAAAIMATLDRLERRYGMDDPDAVLHLLRTGSGVEITVSGGSPEEADEIRAGIEKWLRERRTTPKGEDS